MSSNAQLSRPESPPELKRRILLSFHQCVGGGLLLLIPLLALGNLLGDRSRSIEVRGDEVVAHADFPEGARYGSPVQLVLTLHLSPGDPAREVRVLVQGGYLEHFIQIHALPEIHEVRGEEYVFRLHRRGNERELTLRIDLTPAKFGWAEGRLRIERDGRAALEVPLRTFVFP